MAGQLWSTNSEGGFLYSDEMSNLLRTQMQPLTKFRQLCDPRDGSEKGLNRGDRYTWVIVSDVGQRGRRLDERTPIPETGFTVAQGSLTVYEAGNSVPLTQRVTLMAQHDVESIVDNALRNDCVKYHDAEAHAQFNATPLRVSPAGGNSATSVVLTTNSVASTTNNVALGIGHIKAVSDLMKERNMPAYRGDDYLAVARTSTYRTFKDQLETIKQYTETGLMHIFAGEIGRYEGFRFIEQSNIPRGGANDSTTFDAFSGVSDPWNNALSDWCFFMAADTVIEVDCVLEEIRAKLPGDYGRAKGMAWYWMGAYGLVHTDPANARVIKWDSAA